MNEKTKLLTAVTSAVPPTLESARWLASGTGPRTSTTAETRRLARRRYKTPVLSVKDFRTSCDYISVPMNAASKRIHLQAVHRLDRLPVQRLAFALERRSNTAAAAANPKRCGASLPAALHDTGARVLYAVRHPVAFPWELKDAIRGNTFPNLSLTGKTVTGGRLNVGGL